ncbi:DNA-deoxyinosine glycosylase [Sphingobium fluviale]|uniref:DNA-deoxyinosine glycosylase n=1 Tax=Sphingobium fluviale TaxID=2506423 RepID=A0A4V1N3G2_9SPHN|nr:DNA-deoxyinosine glycosylase [Sphingobium fluviale]RXR28556.1 DNA-deoxyinosine glycosylase [Sphingobium fluviale]
MKTLAQPDDHARCFPPVITPETRLLILGSLPGRQSLAAQQYYAHPRNQFWRLIGEVIDTNLAALPYEARLKRLLAHTIGLWDVVGEAIRPGSLDMRITGAVPNDLTTVLTGLPMLTAIAFNGKTASRVGRHQLFSRTQPATVDTLIDLPSSSPAHTQSYEEKARSWRALKEFIGR